MIQCQICNQMLPHKDYEAHCLRMHPELEEQRIAKTIRTAKEQVAWIMEHNNSAINNNGVLLLKMFQKWPINSARYIYDPGNKQVGIIAESYEDLIYALKHAETITRLGRAWRHINGRQIGIKPLEREAEYAFSTGYWALNKEG